MCIKSSVATKNGNRDGTTEVAQRLIPDLTATKFEFEKIKMEIVNSKNSMDIRFRFNLNTIKLHLNNIKSSLNLIKNV